MNTADTCHFSQGLIQDLDLGSDMNVSKNIADWSFMFCFTFNLDKYTLL